jgi:hypothetical protein
MKKQLLNILFLASFFLATNTGAQNYEWTETVGGTFNDMVKSMVTDRSGNVFYTGYFTGNFDFDGSAAVDIRNCAGSFDFFVVKKDAAGNYLWAKTFGNAGSDRAFSITVDSLDNIIIGGYFQNTLDFDLGSGNATFTPVGAYDAFILKLDNNGNFIWVKTFGGAGSTVWPLSIECDNNGNIVNAGMYQNAAMDADPSANIATAPYYGGVQDIYVQKLDFNGNYIWSASAGGTGVDRANSLTLDNNGNCYIAGYFQNTVDFNTGAGVNNITATSDDGFLLKLDANGNYVNCVASAGASDEQFTSVYYSETNNAILLGGYFSGTLDFDYGAGTDSKTVTGSSNGFVQKLDLSLNHNWVKTVGGANAIRTYAVTSDRTGNIYSAGRFNTTFDLDPGTGTDTRTSNGSFDVFIQKLDASGNYSWGLTFGGIGQDEPNFLAIHNPGALYVSGIFNNSLDFNPFTASDSFASVAVDDGFISKYSFCSNSTNNLNISSCNSYTINNQTYTSSGVYTQRLNNASGCDSIITINLTLSNSSSSTINPVVCSSYTSPSGNYIWTSSNTYLDTIPNTSGCDSIITINLTVNNVNSAVTVNSLTISANTAGANYQWIDCNNGNSPINGETNQSFTATNNGSYAVIIIENGCTDTSACVNITSVGVNDINQSGMSIYPNPFSTQTTIIFDEVQNNSSVKIFNMLGEEIKSINFRGKNLTIERDTMTSGFYFVQITDEQNQIKIRKIVIQ